ncbi:hypothetical protein [Oleiagrimonas sp. MCCC 1A03011]|uniref:hypothetical protein n=1 Tax=Oleiagrimonas sp. MCCC 1A03011 TaxID=1926883 RepID=UPI000DC50CCF|nr:hypothetical protein [Oleiagrimonas sp. MCCC 1A03011]RAP57732.1 hypothetical protein BTJ49_07510 [Oleiagrimonas sp. MCCC 1A03011]
MILYAETCIMKTKVLVLAAVFLLVPLAVVAGESPLHGIWKVDANTIRASHPHAFVIKDGIYECQSCTPSFSLPADGAFHAVPSDPRRDEMAVLVIDAHKVQITERKNGIMVANTLREMNGDNALAEVTYQDFSGKSPVISKFRHHRDGMASGDAHPVSGNWHKAVYTSVSNSGRAFTYNVNGRRMEMNDPRGHAFVARMDGSEAPYTGSHLVSSVSVEKLAPHRVRMQTRHEGQVVGITTVHVLPGGNMMRVVKESPVDGSRLSYVAMRVRSTSLTSDLAPMGGISPGSCDAGGCATVR